MSRRKRVHGHEIWMTAVVFKTSPASNSRPNGVCYVATVTGLALPLKARIVLTDPAEAAAQPFPNPLPKIPKKKNVSLQHHL